MVEENFEIWPFEMHQIDLILLHYLSYFTMVEENFEIWPFEMHQIDSSLLHDLCYTSSWLKKIPAGANHSLRQ